MNKTIKALFDVDKNIRNNISRLLTLGVLGIIITISVTGCFGTYVTLDKELSHSEVVKVDESKDEIYVAANEWMAKNFTNSEKAIRFSNKEEGKLVGRLRTDRTNCTGTPVSYLLNWDITAKDGRYRLQQSPVHAIVHTGNGERQINEIGMSCIQVVKPILADFRKRLKSSISGSSDDF